MICLCIRPKRRRILAQADSYGCLSDCSIEGILANVSIALFLFSLFAVLPLSHNMRYFFLSPLKKKYCSLFNLSGLSAVGPSVVIVIMKTFKVHENFMIMIIKIILLRCTDILLHFRATVNNQSVYLAKTYMTASDFNQNEKIN